MMASIFTKVGVSLILLGVSLLFVIGVFNTSIPLTTETYGPFTSPVSIPANVSHVDILLAENLEHPFYTQITVKYVLLCENGEVSGNVHLLYFDPVQNTLGRVPGTDHQFLLNYQDEKVTKQAVINPEYASSNFDLYLRISWDFGHSNTGNLSLTYRELRLDFLLFTLVIPGLCIVAGLSVVLGGIIFNYRRVIKRTIVTRSWEPILQWGKSDSTPSKTPKMGIKSTHATKDTGEKVAIKEVPNDIPLQICKFCGKQIPASALLCPHCYAELR